MTIAIALLRGINVGGARVIPMADLRAVVAGCGYDDVVSYVQSGNLVFRAKAADTESIAETLSTAIAEATSVRTRVIVRTREEWGDIIAAQPFGGSDVDPRHLHVLFLPGRDSANLEEAALADFSPERAVAIGREAFLYLPRGVGRSALAAAVQKQTSAAGTQRNWSTVSALAGLADALADR